MRGGIIFDPEYGESSHRTHAAYGMHAVSLNSFEILLLAHFQTARYFAFDPLRTIQGGSKAKFEEYMIT